MRNYTQELKEEIKALKEVYRDNVKVIFTQSKYDAQIVEMLVIKTKPSIETNLFTFIRSELYDMTGTVTLSTALKVNKIFGGKI